MEGHAGEVASGQRQRHQMWQMRVIGQEGQGGLASTSTERGTSDEGGSKCTGGRRLTNQTEATRRNVSGSQARHQLVIGR